ncbi:hypothetical protein OUZ56_014949 [Daphnia magna]|uniref:Secreted protein n=1 Tax=Daphnia magna TaxID=35525 RepID=A0ABR0ALE5_9CRUS|nr:hypothetical protein OUZ56_014949 [Daphnia magna]
MDYNKSTSYVIVLDLFHFMVVILCLLLKSPVGLGFVGADIISEEREEMRYCIENAGSSSSLYRRWLNREPNRRNPKKLTRATSKPANLTGVLLVGCPTARLKAKR